MARKTPALEKAQAIKLREVGDDEELVVTLTAAQVDSILGLLRTARTQLSIFEADRDAQALADVEWEAGVNARNGARRLEAAIDDLRRSPAPAAAE